MWGLPLAFVGAVFSVIFCVGRAPVPVAFAWALLSKSAVIMFLAWWLSAVLLPYPFVFLIAVCISVLLAYDLQLRTGDLLLSVFAVIAALLMPYLTRTSPDLAGTIGFWLMVNLLVALLVSWVVFLLFPAAPPDAQGIAKPAAEALSYNRERRLFRLACVAVPFILGAFVFDLITPFVMVFAAIQSTQFVANTAAQSTVAKDMLTANCIGGLIAVIVYEAMVAAPFLPFACFVILAAMLWLSQRLVAGDARMMSAVTAFLILVGGTLMPFADDAQTKMLARLWQFGIAFGYLSIAFLIVDRLLPERQE